MMIRDFKPPDADACLEIRADAFVRTFEDELGPDVVKSGLDAYDRSKLVHLSEAGKSFVADDGAVIGFCTIVRKEPTVAELLLVYVRLNRHKEGIGRMLVTHAEHWISANWPEVVQFEAKTVVPKYNRYFYDRIGFLSVGKAEVEFPDRRVPALSLRKQITRPLEATSQ
jgi:GNAT superfamily N-acetyltransferase